MTKHVSMHLTQDEWELIDKYAKKLDVSKNHLVRSIFFEWDKRQQKNQKKRAKNAKLD